MIRDGGEESAEQLTEEQLQNALNGGTLGDLLPEQMAFAAQQMAAAPEEQESSSASSPVSGKENYGKIVQFTILFMIMISFVQCARQYQMVMNS